MPAMGRRVDTLAPGRDEEKWRKSITSVLREGHEALWIDNLVHPLDSGTLAAALTTSVWEDRILGQSRTIRVPVRCVWLATANNPVLSRELTRRSVRIRIAPKVDRPWPREVFPLCRFARLGAGTSLRLRVVRPHAGAGLARRRLPPSGGAPTRFL